MDKKVNLYKMTLEETGLLSTVSHELRKFIFINKLRSVDEFIDCVDNNLFLTSTYADVLAEARGLSDLLKQKYLNIQLITDVYLDLPIKKLEFRVRGYWDLVYLYGVILPNNDKKNIYNVINRLGFNDEERQIILDRVENIENTLVIDLLHDAYNRTLGSESLKDEIFRNKILIILKSYLSKKHSVVSKFTDKMNKTIEEFNDILTRKAALELASKKNKQMLQSKGGK